MTKPKMNNNLKTYATTAIIAIAFASMIMLAPTSALAAKPGAQGVQFTQPPPTVSCSGSSCTTTPSELSGLGNQQVRETLTVFATFNTQCTNRGGNIAPGQDDVTTSTSTSADVTPHNGKATLPPLSATAQQPTQQDLNRTCPNGSWTGSVDGQPVVTASLTVVYNNVLLSSDSFP